MPEQPLDWLEKWVDSEIHVTLKSGATLEGTLKGYDQHMNLVLDEGNETTIIRGDNLVSIQGQNSVITT